MRTRKSLLILCATIISLAAAGKLSAQSYLGNFTSYTANGNEVTVRADSSALRFIFYRPNIVRVDYLPILSTEFQPSLVVIPDSEQQVSVTATEGDSSVTLATSQLEVVLSKYPLRVTFFGAGDRLLLREPAAGGVSSDRSERSANFAIQSGEHFYGTGERGLSFDLRGLSFDSYNEQHGGYPTGGIPPTMNVNIPFIVSSNHYGIYFEDTYEGHFDVGASSTGRLTYTAAGGELSYYLIYDPTYGGILSDYTWLTGRAPLLPKWAYGYIQSKFGYRNYRTRSRRYKPSVPIQYRAMLSSSICIGSRTWETLSGTSTWPDPNRITSMFLSQGFKTIVITEPYIVQNSLNFAVASGNGYLAKNALGQNYIMSNWWSCNCNAGLLDITNPEAQSWWWSKYRHIFQTGVSGIWTDLGEPKRDYEDMKFHMGADAQVHNVYDFLWAETLFNGFAHSFPGDRLFNLTRSGYAGIQRFGTVTWSGDVAKTFAGLAVQLPILLNMSMSGITYHNSDIGGFTGTQPTTPELYTRWMEFGAFCPVMRAHGYDGLGGTEPWAFNSTSPSTEGIVRNIIRLRYSLMPYNYTMAHEAYETGLPMVRPLVMEYPGDPNVADESDAYMWGDDFLVAPVVEAGQTSATFYLPQGKWIDYWNDSAFDGGQTVTVPAPIDQIPLLVKAGSIIPMQPVMQYAGEFPADTMMLAVYPAPGLPARFTLYEDDGKTLAYQSGSYSTTTFGARMNAGGSTDSSDVEISIGKSLGNYDGKPSRRVYVCIIHSVSYQPRNVTVEGVPIPVISTRDMLQRSPAGFYYDNSGKVLYVKLSAGADSSYDIEIDSVGLTGVKRSIGGPSGYELNQNYPNPFNPSTVIGYTLSSGSFVTLKVYDILGRVVATLVSRHEDAGEHTAIFDGRSLTSGVYFYRLTAGPFDDSREMVFLK